MPKKKQEQLTDEKGRRICGAKNKSKVNKRGVPRTNTICHRFAMANGRCMIHGGKSTGPKNSVEYYKKQVIDREGSTSLEEALSLTKPMDLSGEIGLVRNLITQMMDDPLRAFCTTCKQWVQVLIECPNEEHMNADRAADGKPPQGHHVRVRDNDYSKMVLATKQLSEVVKNHKEVQKGKEITLRVEVLNLVILKIVEAYEEADKIEDPEKRRRKFIEYTDRLLIETTTGEAFENARLTGAAERR